jgi:thiol-disulfide isomerase/thioredoxin
MKSKLKHYAKEAISFIVIMIIFANAISLYKSQSLNNNPLTLTKVKLLNNQVYSLPNKKPILVHFWATWCPTCKLEAANIEFLSHHFEVLTIAVNSKSDADIQKYLYEHGYTFKVVNDNRNIIASNAKIVGLPTTFIYDKNKNLVFSDVGYSSTFTLYLKMLWAKMK